MRKRAYVYVVLTETVDSADDEIVSDVFDSFDAVKRHRLYRNYKFTYQKGGFYMWTAISHDCAQRLWIRRMALKRRGSEMSETRSVGSLELIAQLDAAHDELVAAVRRQWDGAPAFKLSIPAQPDRDTDLLIGAALRAARAALQREADATASRSCSHNGPMGYGCCLFKGHEGWHIATGTRGNICEVWDEHGYAQPVTLESDVLTASTERAIAALRGQGWQQHPDAKRALAAVQQIERHCPCGARPESPNTHHHVAGCPVEAALVYLTPASSVPSSNQETA